MAFGHPLEPGRQPVSLKAPKSAQIGHEATIPEVVVDERRATAPSRPGASSRTCRAMRSDNFAVASLANC